MGVYRKDWIFKILSITKKQQKLLACILHNTVYASIQDCNEKSKKIILSSCYSRNKNNLLLEILKK